jgi:hydrogenase-4 component B
MAAAALALIGGLAAACFTKVFGMVFLGLPRQALPRQEGEVPRAMLAGMGFLAFFIVFIGLFSVGVAPFVSLPARALAGAGETAAGPLMAIAKPVTIILISILVLFLLVFAALRWLVSGRTSIAKYGTWDCGYSRPTASMQYTASSFAALIINWFGQGLALHREVVADKRILPVNNWHFHSAVNDWMLTRIFLPGFAFGNRALGLLRWMQSGKTSQYVLYIAITVFCLIIWKFLL